MYNGNHLSFGISFSSAEKPVEFAILAGTFIDADHRFIQEELKGEEFNSPVMKLGRNRNANEMRHSAACEKVMENSQLSITFSTRYAERG